jgi:hypothetical protein
MEVEHSEARTQQRLQNAVAVYRICARVRSCTSDGREFREIRNAYSTTVQLVRDKAADNCEGDIGRACTFTSAICKMHQWCTRSTHRRERCETTKGLQQANASSRQEKHPTFVPGTTYSPATERHSSLHLVYIAVQMVVQVPDLFQARTCMGFADRSAPELGSS